MKFKLTVLLLCLMPSLLASEADRLRDKGFELLKAAQDDPNKIILAAQALADAAGAYQFAGDDKNAQEMESYLFWAKKKMTIQQIDAFLARGGEPAKRTMEWLETAEKKAVKPEDAALYLARADGYAEGAKDSFLIAVRYFEVASRFKGTPEGEKAMEKSLNAMQQSKPTQVALASVQEDNSPVNVPWDSIKLCYAIVKVNANSPTQPISLGAGQWQIIPNMTDRWSASPIYSAVSCNGMSIMSPRGYPFMLLLSKFTPAGATSETTSRYDVLLTGPGKLVLQADDNPESYHDNSGFIRVKIVKRK